MKETIIKNVYVKEIAILARRVPSRHPRSSPEVQ